MLAAVGAVLTLASLPEITNAQPSAHYPVGIEGIKGATLPPPGVYLRDYNLFYYANRVNDSQGNEISAADPEALIYANVPRLVWITDMKLFGAFVGLDALLPLQYTDLGDDHHFGIGDAFAEGTLSWHLKQLDIGLGYGFWAPTGDAPPPPTNPGKGYWGHMFTAGATLYFDPQKKWAFSALNRFEINMEDDDTGMTAGDAYTVECGLSYGISKTVDIGVAGYYQQQVTDDSGTGSTNVRDRAAGVGPEISVFYPRATLGWSLRYLYDVMAEDRLQGHTVCLTITKRF